MAKVALGSVAGLLAIACAALVMGCGGGDSEETLTKAQFEEKAGAICDKSLDKRSEVLEEVAQTVNPKNVKLQQQQAIEKGIPTYEEAAQQIADLSAPEGEEEKVEAMVDAMEEAAEQVYADPQTAIQSNLPFRDANKLLKPYGLDSCIV